MKADFVANTHKSMIYEYVKNTKIYGYILHLSSTSKVALAKARASPLTG
jgi:hypothetical protein